MWNTVNRGDFMPNKLSATETKTVYKINKKLYI